MWYPGGIIDDEHHSSGRDDEQSCGVHISQHGDHDFDYCSDDECIDEFDYVDDAGLVLAWS